MRFGLVLSVAGFVLCGSTAAMAQTYYQTNGTPIFVPMTGAQGYTTTQTGAVPFYNNNTQPLPMDQLVAGKNAPSYNFGGTQPYNSFGGSMTNSNGVLTPEAVAQLRAQRDAQAQQYEQQFLQSGQANNQQGTLGAVQNAYNSFTGQQQQQPARPVKRQLVYRQQDNPLAAPPRLFNPDQ